MDVDCLCRFTLRFHPQVGDSVSKDWKSPHVTVAVFHGDEILRPRLKRDGTTLNEYFIGEQLLLEDFAFKDKTHELEFNRKLLFDTCVNCIPLTLYGEIVAQSGTIH
jgi:hypothetical protein